MPLISDADVGIASVSTDVFTSVELLSGDTPAVVTTNEPIASALLTSGIPARTLVGRDGSGNLVKAVLGSVAPIGITVVTVAAASGAGTKVPVYRAGCFNPAALAWDASYDTDEKKRLAFEGSNPQIFIKKNPTQG